VLTSQQTSHRELPDIPGEHRAAVPSRAVVPLVEARDLCVEFREGDRCVKAVDGVGFQLHAGRTLAVIGESGAGKSVSCRALIGLLPQGARVSGSVRFNGKELVGLPDAEMRIHRGADIAIVFQDADHALNPTMRVGYQITEAIRQHESINRREARDRAIELLTKLKVPAPIQRFDAYSHQLSGGMRQRVMLAMALASKPKVLIADEMTRALDVTTQAQIMRLLVDLQRETGMSIILISHDLTLAARVSDDVLVMYAGRPAEHAPTAELFSRPRMPYTKALLDSASNIRSSRAPFVVVPGQPSSAARAPANSCAFVPRCGRATPTCAIQRPALLEHEPSRHYACWHPCSDGHECQ
jgi:oligopeptide/dipeptide ABC transporter ATP-binding protein